MSHILLINPNTSKATTQMMVSIARDFLAGEAHRSQPPYDKPIVVGSTVSRGVPMIVDENDLRVAEEAVNTSAIVLAAAAAYGVIVGAFGDPGIDGLRAKLSVPVVGIGEASMREAAERGRRFGIATTTPALASSIEANVRKHGLAAQFTGVRLTQGDPQALGNEPDALADALADAAQACIRTDGAQAVVIGGGPLGRAAQSLSARFSVPVIGPVPAACRALLRALQRHGSA